MTDIYQKLWEVKHFVFKRAGCWFVGHDEKYGSALNYEDDWCDRCYISWPQDTVTLPVLLGRVYVWAVGHGWPEWVDQWLMKHVRLPGWWEY